MAGMPNFTREEIATAKLCAAANPPTDLASRRSSYKYYRLNMQACCRNQIKPQSVSPSGRDASDRVCV